MAQSFILSRTKPNGAADPDPTLGIFKPPETEIFKPSLGAQGVRFALVYLGGITFTATVIVYARDQATGTWFKVSSQGMVPHRQFIERCKTGAHELWLGLANITGGSPIRVYVEEVD
jgi:hypothetical protein